MNSFFKKTSFLMLFSAGTMFSTAFPIKLLATPDAKLLTSKERAASLIHEGLNYLILEKFKKAEELFLQAKSIDPYSEQAYNFLGLLYLQDNLSDKAEDMLKRQLQLSRCIQRP